MKQRIAELISQSLSEIQSEESLEFTIPESIQVETTRDQSHGDFASNIALILSKPAAIQPRKLAELICKHLPDSNEISKVEIAGPGFINFFLDQATQFSVIEKILTDKNTFGKSNFGKNKSVLIEFVSANPTGPLHVGHGRGAAYGDVVANLLQAIGFKVDREYYVNDAGRQMDILAASVYLRYLEIYEKEFIFPANAYQGDYIIDIAQSLQDQFSDHLVRDISVPHVKQPLEPTEEQKTEYKRQLEIAMDELIGSCKQELDDEYQTVHKAGLDSILENIRDDLKSFGVEFDRWYSERSLGDNDKISTALNLLEEHDHIYEKDGAKWFRSEALGDEKDRVVVRDNGEGTYFASDIAYHHDKLNRGYDKIIDIWGADHHGYIARVRAALKALGQDDNKLDILLVQFVSLFRGQEKIQMSTRSGQFITLEELREDVGTDATRFFYVMRKSEQHLDFDLELAKSKNKENPVYYIQYAHARICRLLEKLESQGISTSNDSHFDCLENLTEIKETELLKTLAKYPETIQKAAIQYEPHNLVYFLKDLSNEFHTYYDTHRILDEPEGIQKARITLCLAVKQVIQNGLDLLGVTAPEAM